jgi:hypothetical protein
MSIAISSRFWGALLKTSAVAAQKGKQPGIAL